MTQNLYTSRNYLSVATHYAGAGLIATGGLMLASPWAIGAGILVTAGIHRFLSRSYIKFIENKLVAHPDAHRFSPNLGKIVQELYKKAGISSDKYPIYDFRADQEKTARSNSLRETLFEELSNLAAQTPNAAALRTGKTTIMISEPLLKLLDDEEEKAVIAHEFAHAACRHSYIMMPQRLIGSASTLTVSFSIMAAALSTGFAGMAAFAAALIVTQAAFRKIHKSGDLYKKERKELSLTENAALQKMNAMRGTVRMALNTAIFTVLNPAYLPLYAAGKGLSYVNRVLTATFSRSNEYQADRGAVVLGADPLALITSLRKMTIVIERSKLKAYDGKLPEAGMLSAAWKKATSTHPVNERRYARLAAIARAQGRAEADIEKALKGPIEVSAEHDMPYEVIKKLVTGL